jgi:hypothetical protein
VSKVASVVAFVAPIGAFLPFGTAWWDLVVLG